MIKDVYFDTTKDISLPAKWKVFEDLLIQGAKTITYSAYYAQECAQLLCRELKDPKKRSYHVHEPEDEVYPILSTNSHLHSLFNYFEMML